MKLMPFLVADDSCVTCTPPTLRTDQQVINPNEEVEGWDYLSQVTINGELTVDPVGFSAATGLSEDEILAGVVAVIKVECPSTGARYIGSAPIAPRGRSTRLSVPIEAGSAAGDLQTHYEVVLRQGTRKPTADRRATAPGSRLYTSSSTFRFHLGSSDSLFPVEAFKFGGGDFPVESAWLLKFRADDLSIPYLSATRLFVNTAHPAYTAMKNRPSTQFDALLVYQVLLQMLVTVAIESPGSVADTYDENSSGSALNGLCSQFLDSNLRATIDELRNDPGRTFARLQAGMQLFMEEGQ